mmetsp:Transcript_41224/g.87844  ORF Transcript_41224/g.87844 Transcript_41224/m.87844 type:complete len:1067 (-) Transcript_41224:249-3449(-)
MGDYLREEESFLQHDAAPPVLGDAPTTTIATAMLFGSIIFATASLAARLWLTGMWSWRNGGCSDDGTGKSRPLDTTSLPSIYGLLYYSTVFGLILFYSYICEHHPPFFHEEKTYDRDEFFFWTILVVVFAGGHSLKRNNVIKMRNIPSAGGAGDRSARGKDGSRLQMIDEDGQSQTQVAVAPSTENEVLNRYQTEEWKGWMQVTFLLYHYMHAMEIYNGIRVMITCYIWMTGFGNFSFFYLSNDYSLPRVLQMLWRLNFLVFFLCLTHGNPYILYYICPLHTYFFFMVYAVMSIGKEKNYTKWWIRIKLGVLALLIYILWDTDTEIFERMHTLFLSEEPVAGATMGTKWEWYFRSYLDHWSTLLGMVFALNFPIISLFYRKLEARSKPRQWMGKLAVAFGMLLLFCLWVKGPLMYGKIAYNSTNPYFGFIPLVTYIYIRNITPRLRSYSMELLHEIGKTTLETYLMQHHIWLTSNSKTILVFLPGWPRVNLALVTYLYVIFSRKLHKLTLLLRGMLLPDDRGACINSLVGMAVTIAGFYCTAFLLDGVEMTSLLTVGLVSMVSGALLYQTVLDSSWSTYRKSIKKMKETSDDDYGDEYSAASQSETHESSERLGEENDTIYGKLCPPIIGAMVLFVLGFTWNGFAAAGASAIGPLPPRCDAFVNDGIWIPIDGCNEASRGMAYRDFGAASYGTCAPHGNSYVWAWKEQLARTRCRFGYRNEAKLKQSLNRREVVFIGDSMTRYVYHASARAMGIKDSGAYDATGPKHADISNILWETTLVKFKWAPLAVDQLNVLKEINRQASEGTEFRPPDLIFLGGGAWDRLHVYATDEDRQSHAAILKDLGGEMQKAQQEYGAAVVWFIPTTINSQALNTEEKRDHMREEDMEAMRAVYARNGILSSSSFVIDGPAFTSSRVAESYDGVHYPIQVYDAGAQILFNALDWLLPPGIVEPATPPRVGKMANPILGMMMLILVTIGLVGFDGFLGLSYLASLFVKGVMPYNLHEEAFSALHKKLGITGSPARSSGQQQPVTTRKKSKSSVKKRGRGGNVDEEIAALLGPKQDVEIS